MKFEIIHTSSQSRARVGKIYTPHGEIDTPNFVAVATNGTIKALDNVSIGEIGLQLMFCNTYHLLLQPGVPIIHEAGGLHSFINRKIPIITDSGGFQVFSLAKGFVANELKSRRKKEDAGSVIKITEEGVLFRSYRTGDKILLTPESSIEAQKKFRSDIILPLDELLPHSIDEQKLLSSFERTHRWEKRSLDVHLKNPQNQAIYGIVHGGTDLVLRKKSCEFLTNLPFDGFSIGGSLGASKDEMVFMLTETMGQLPRALPTHLLGIGDLESIKRCLPLGIDTFDSSYPTRAARHGMALHKKKNLNLTKGEMARCFIPIDVTCTCYTCTHFTVGYIHHLFKAREITALTLTTIHNLHFMIEAMKSYRRCILENLI
jgi:queuine tRNA-ribosyltransferase